MMMMMIVKMIMVMMSGKAVNDCCDLFFRRSCHDNDSDKLPTCSARTSITSSLDVPHQ